MTPNQVAHLLLCTDDYPKAWETAEKLGGPVSMVFWQYFRTHGLGSDFSHVAFAAEHLLNANRPNAALGLIALYLHQKEGLSRERAELVVRSLEALLKRELGVVEIDSMEHYHLMQLFEALEQSVIPQERVAQLEWLFLPAFGYDGRPRALTSMLSADPNFFVEIIRHVFKPHTTEEVEEAEKEQEEFNETRDAAIARNGYHLLMGWMDIPGLREDGTLDAAAFEAWVATARAKLRESGHLEDGDRRIGHVLAWGPTDSDGTRPCLAIRNLLENLQSPNIEAGLEIELANSRGVTTRGVYDGGDQERTVAVNYFEQAKKFADRWPRTAAILRRLGEGYEREGRQIDDRAERHRTGFDS